MENTQHHEMKGGKKTDYEFVFQIVLIAILSLLLAFDAGRVYAANTGGKVISSGTSVQQGNVVSASGLSVVPTGTPEVYGSELGVKYDDVSPNDPALADATIKKLRAYEDIELDPAQMDRYIRIAGSISCEYCCGAQSIIFSNGQRACGCAHSYAMRGLAKYLLTKHSDMTDEQILSELGKWKVLFFPGIHEQKAQVLKAKGIDPTDYINLASNKYRGIEKGQTSGSGGGMVGGC